MDLKQSYIKGIFQPAFYTRGLRYFQTGRVLSLKVLFDAEDLLDFEAEVMGSAKAPYHCDITFSRYEKKGKQWISVEGDCSCPVSYNCKHVIAACLKYVNRPPTSETSQLNWLDEIGQDRKLQEPDSDNQFPLLLFCLSFGYKKGVLELEVFQSYHKKRGGLAKAKPLSIANIYYDNHFDRYTESQQTILRLIKASTPYYGDDCKIKGELGGLLLKQLVTSGYCYWQSIGGDPFNFGPTLDMKLQWQEQNKEQSQLIPKFDDPKAQVLLTEPGYYISIEKRLIGGIENPGFSSTQLAAIINSPLVSKKTLPKLSQKLALDYPTLNIPRPIDIEVHRIEAETFVPMLTLARIRHQQYQFHTLDLQYRYGPVVVESNPQETVSTAISGDQIFQIHRDLDGEIAAEAILLDLGFERFVATNGKKLFYAPADSYVESINRWYNFVEFEIQKLTRSGWEIGFDESFALSFLPPDDCYAEVQESGNNWFELRFDLEVKGKKVSLVPLIVNMLNNYALDEIPERMAIPFGETENLVLSREQIEPVIQTLTELFDAQTPESFRLDKFDAARLADLDNRNQTLQIKGSGKLLELGQKLLDFKGIQPVALPQGLIGELREYQRTGINWLQFLREYEFNGILADDMGLGKTVQVLTHLLIEKEAGRLAQPCLIIAPTSLMSNWRREAQHFTPDLKVVVLQGTQRSEFFEHLQEYDIILSTYPLLWRDRTHLIKQHWSYVILDEAQMVKNPKAQASRVIRELKTSHKLCLTGTPMENHLGELWSLFDFLMPGFLADEKSFRSIFRTPVEKYADRGAAQRLAERVRPFLLRRKKEDVLKELPAKTTILRTVELGAPQARLYESIRLSMEKKVRDAIASKGLNRSHITILDALLKLRQVCCDPRLVRLTQSKNVKSSAKLELLMDMLQELLEEGRKVLIFSQFTSMLVLIELALEEQGILYSKLTGQSRNRELIIDEFKSGATDVFLISLKAGGLGLNLTEADSVIIFDPWWNPAVENQAADRVHRIGQQKPVFVYKLIVENSVEEKIMALQAQKEALAQSIYHQDGESTAVHFTAEDIQNLFAPLKSVE